MDRNGGSLSCIYQSVSLVDSETTSKMLYEGDIKEPLSVNYICDMVDEAFVSHLAAVNYQC